MSRSSSSLDIEFEQVLGSWLDHCSESLSIIQEQQNQNQNNEDSEQQQENNKSLLTTLELLQQNDNTGMLLLTPSLLSQNQNNSSSNNSDDTLWLKSVRSTIDRFKSMIPDNMEKLREIFKVIFTRVRDFSRSKATAQYFANTAALLNNEDAAVQEQNNSSSSLLLGAFLPKRFSGVSRKKHNTTSSLLSAQQQASSSSSSLLDKQHFSILPPTPELAHLIRRSLFFWLVFDTFIQTFPLVACQWCLQCRDDFLTLIEHALPWEYACEWCDHTVSNCWVPLFRNLLMMGSSSASSNNNSSGNNNFANRLETIARQRRTAVVMAQSLAAEQSKKHRIELEEAKTRDASTQEMRELHELTQRLIAALNRHKPSDGRLAVVKIENNNLNNQNDEDAAASSDPFSVKQEMTMKLQAQALHFQDVGNTADDAWDVDEEYEPGYVAGAKMGVLKKDEDESKTLEKKEEAVVGKPNQDSAAAGGGRRAPRVRPR